MSAPILFHVRPRLNLNIRLDLRKCPPHVRSMSADVRPAFHSTGCSLRFASDFTMTREPRAKHNTNRLAVLARHARRYRGATIAPSTLGAQRTFGAHNRFARAWPARPEFAQIPGRNTDRRFFSKSPTMWRVRTRRQAIARPAASCAGACSMNVRTPCSSSLLDRRMAHQLSTSPDRDTPGCGCHTASGKGAACSLLTLVVHEDTQHPCRMLRGTNRSD